MKQTGAILAAVAGFSLAGSSVVANRIIGADLPPFGMVFLSLLAGLPVLAFAVRRQSRPLFRAPLRLWGRATLQGLGGIVLFRLLLLTGMGYLDGPGAALILGTGPLLLGLGGMLFYGDRPGRGAWIGMGLASLGLALLRFGPGGSTDWLGALCIFGAVVGETAMSLLGRRTPAETDQGENAWRTVFSAAVLVAPLALGEILKSGLPHPSTAALAALLFYGIGPTAFGYLCWSHAAARLDSATLGICTAAVPLSALAFSALLLGERPGLVRLAAVFLVAAGMVVFARGGPRRRAE